MVDKKIPKKEIRQLLDKGKEIVNASGAQLIKIEKELNEIELDERELRQKLSLLL